MSDPADTVSHMTIPTREQIEAHPTEWLAHLQVLRREIDEAESLAISVELRRTWKLITLAQILGISRQALTQRMQHKLQTSRPNVKLREIAAGNLDSMQRIRERDRANDS